MNEVWDIMSAQLFFMHHAFQISIHSFVLMSNHFHLLVSTPQANLPEAMAFFMRETSREIVRQANRINQTWGGPYFRTFLRTEAHFLNAYKYVYRNPVSAGLSPFCESYPFSTLHGLLGGRPLTFPVHEDTLLFSPHLNLRHLEWLNTANAADEEEVRCAMKKSTFEFRKKNKRPLRPADFIF